jgi:hypothetical protein
MSREFLPPDAHAHVEPTLDAPPRADDRSPVAPLAAAVAGLALAFFGGWLFVISVPASIAGWVLGVRARRRAARRDHADLAVLIAVIGIVFGTVAALGVVLP